MMDYIYVGAPAIAFLFSLLSWRLRIRHAHIVTIILGIELVMSQIVFWGRYHNRIVIEAGNVTILFDTGLWAWYFRLIICNKLVKRLLLAYIVVFTICWAISIFILSGLNHLQSNLEVITEVGLVLMSIWYYYEFLTSEILLPSIQRFEFWISAGLIFFHLGIFLYYGMLVFLNYNPLSFNHRVSIGIEILDIIYYSTLIYAFRCLMTSKTSRIF